MNRPAAEVRRQRSVPRANHRPDRSAGGRRPIQKRCREPWLCKDGNCRSRDEPRSIAGHPRGARPRRLCFSRRWGVKLRCPAAAESSARDPFRCEGIDKSVSQTPRRYPGTIFFANVNRFTLVKRAGSDDPNREVTQGGARSGPVPMGLFDPHAIFGRTPWKRAKSARA